MKRKTLLLLTLVPVLTGYLLNLTILIPGLGMLLYYLMPCITLIFWFFLGDRYSTSEWNFIQSTIIGNGVGIPCSSDLFLAVSAERRRQQKHLSSFVFSGFYRKHKSFNC